MVNDERPMSELEMLCTEQARVLVLDKEHGVCVGGRYDGYLMRRHVDGYWVTARKLEAVDPREGWTALLPT